MASRRTHRYYNYNRNEPKRSMLLESFRTNRAQNLQLSDIVSHFVEFATDFDGSKFIQRKLDDVTGHRKDMIFREMKPHMLRLMTDKFANFVMQKMFDICDGVERVDLVGLIQDNFMMLSLNKYGCRVVQRALEKVSVQEQIQLVSKCSKHDIVRLSKDPNGNHVIQKYFRHGSPLIKVRVQYFANKYNTIQITLLYRYQWFF